MDKITVVLFKYLYIYQTAALYCNFSILAYCNVLKVHSTSCVCVTCLKTVVSLVIYYLNIKVFFKLCSILC